MKEKQPLEQEIKQNQQVTILPNQCRAPFPEVTLACFTLLFKAEEWGECECRKPGTCPTLTSGKALSEFLCSGSFARDSQHSNRVGCLCFHYHRPHWKCVYFLRNIAFNLHFSLPFSKQETVVDGNRYRAIAYFSINSY